MLRNVTYSVLASHVALKRSSTSYSSFFDKMSGNSFANAKNTLQASASSANLSNMSFGTGRLYLKSHRCLALSVAIVLVIMVFFVYGLNNGGRWSLSYGTVRLQYGIMIDAGSTGSRVHVYKFLEARGNSPPVLQDEVFEQVKPGLSSFADNPQEGVKSIESLLDIAKASIPREMWSLTPLALKATAGLRLLPGKKAQVLLEEVDELFDASPFKIPEDPVMIMDGTDEGIYAWLTVNYLLNLIGQDTVGTIDLGGGSMQITFAPLEADTVRSSPKDYIHDTAVFSDKLKVYVHSYLGLGLMSARELILTGPKPGSAVEVSSVCMPEGYNGEWSNAQTKYSITGTKFGKGKYDACHDIAKAAIQGKIHRPEELKRETWYAFSYFFDRAAENGIIHPEKGGIISVRTYEETARKVCDSIDAKSESPFMCMDLTIIVTFLRDGYGFSPDMYLNIRKKINGKENSWALGGTFFLMDHRTE